MPLHPSRALIGIVLGVAALALGALLWGVNVDVVSAITAGVGVVLSGGVFIDGVLSARAWNRSPLRLTRELPAALALGVRAPVRLVWAHAASAPTPWHARVFDHADRTLELSALPLNITVAPGQQLTVSYFVTPRQRGLLHFAPAQLWVRSRGRLLELQRFVGPAQSIRVYPDFATVARYAWLAGDRRLTEIGIKTFVQRGEGTDFKALTEYRAGESLRHIDWKATLKWRRPIVREFQDERDQNVVFLLDCGRRMRADETQPDQEGGSHFAHFDHALNAVMLLAYVALKQGDAVGAQTFGHAQPERAVQCAPRKGIGSFNALMAALGAVQPEPEYSDYLQAARDVMQHFRQRALVVLITNFRDEDADELAPALRLLRTRHRVITASMRERALHELMQAPLNHGEARRMFDVAGAHLFEQSRRDAFMRLAAHDQLLVDVLPEALPIELVNRYHAVKRAGLL